MLSINYLNVLKPIIWRGFPIQIGVTGMFGIGTMPKKHNEFELSNAPIVNRNAMLINTPSHFRQQVSLNLPALERIKTS